MRGLGGEQDEVGLPGAEHGRREPVEEVSAAFDGDGGQASGAEGDRADPPREGFGSGPVQQYGGQRARQVRPGQCGPAGFLDHDGEVEQGPALQVRLQQPRLRQRVPVGGPHPGPRRAVEQLAHLLGRHGPRHPASYGLGQLPLFPSDSDAHGQAG